MHHFFPYALKLGVGIFEVDRQRAQMTKRRIIDSGVGSDLICLGEPPLHAVPLLKFTSKSEEHDKSEDYRQEEKNTVKHIVLHN